jgi:hypothetical protein
MDGFGLVVGAAVLVSIMSLVKEAARGGVTNQTDLSHACDFTDPQTAFEGCRPVRDRPRGPIDVLPLANPLFLCTAILMTS